MLAPAFRLAIVSPVVAVLGFIAPAAMAQNATPAMYKWTKGDKQFFRWSEQSKTKLSGSPGMESESVQGRISTQTWDVTDVKDGVATIKATYNAFAIESQMPKGPINKYDSQNAQDVQSGSVLSAVFGPIVGESFTFMVDGTGNVTKVEGMAAIVAKMKERSKDVQGSTTYSNDLTKTMSDERIRKNLARVLAGGSEKGVKAGDTWTDTLDLPLERFGGMKLDRTVTLQSVEKDLAILGFAIKISLNELKDGDPDKAMMSVFNPKMENATGTGERRLNGKGQLIKSAFNLMLPIEMSYPGQGTIKSEMNIRLSLDRLEKLPELLPAPAAAPAAPAKAVDPNAAPAKLSLPKPEHK